MIAGKVLSLSAVMKFILNHIINKDILKVMIKEIFEDSNFKEFLENLNSNFYTVKQEIQIRNFILESLNKKLQFDSDLRAFAEYPREGNQKVDLSLISKNSNYLIEIKFQFPIDIHRHNCFKSVIEYNLFKRKIINNGIDLLIIIVSEWQKNDFLVEIEKYGVLLNLTQYQCSDRKWICKLQNDLSSNQKIIFEKIEIEIFKPYKTNYHIFMITKR